MIKKLLLSLLLGALLTGCVSKKKIVYFQDIDSKTLTQANYQPVLQPDDLLLIIVSAPDPEAAAPYNLYSYNNITAASPDASSGGSRLQSYLIDSEGNIQFPVLGSIKMAGLTKSEAVEKLRNELKKYIISPIVNMRIVNYKISVLGEVMRPGVFPVATERISLPEALSSAGDMTIYGDRKRVLIIRETDSVKTHNIVDMTSADFVNSPFYYLDQNDVVYVTPNKTKVNASAIGPNITVGISALSLVITIVALITR